MEHTLSKEEYQEILIVRHLSERDYTDKLLYLKNLMDDCSYWDRKISGLNHILSLVLERFEKQGIPNQKVIDHVYNMRENINFTIQEGDIRFIESLFSNDLNTSVSLEEELILAENRIHGTR